LLSIGGGVGLSKFYANAGGKQSILRQPLLVQYKHQTNPLWPINNYTPLVISRNGKNKQPNIVKPTQTGINRNKYTFCIMKSSEQTEIEHIQYLYS
jgi:hypothetical protein